MNDNFTLSVSDNEIEKNTEPTIDNPDGISFVPESALQDFGKNRPASSGTGAAGTVVGGPIVGFITRSKVFTAEHQSVGDNASQATTYIIMQTLDASPAHPYVVEFTQRILDSFTGLGQFDLVERNASDVVDGPSQVTIATKSGFIGAVVKTITVDKVYSIIFVPGDTGYGIYSIKVMLKKPTM